MNPVEEVTIPSNGEALLNMNSEELNKIKEEITVVERKNSLDRPRYRYYFNLEDEVIKLHVLVLTCDTNKKDEHGEYISRSYLLEKIGRLNRRIPLTLDPRGKEIFDMIIDDYRPGLFSMTYSEILEFFSGSSFNSLRLKNQLARLSIEELSKFSLKLDEERELRDKARTSIEELIKVSKQLQEVSLSKKEDQEE